MKQLNQFHLHALRLSHKSSENIDFNTCTSGHKSPKKCTYYILQLMNLVFFFSRPHCFLLSCQIWMRRNSSVPFTHIPTVHFPISEPQRLSKGVSKIHEVDLFSGSKTAKMFGQDEGLLCRLL